MSTNWRAVYQGILEVHMRRDPDKARQWAYDDIVILFAREHRGMSPGEAKQRVGMMMPEINYHLEKIAKL